VPASPSGGSFLAQSHHDLDLRTLHHKRLKHRPVGLGDGSGDVLTLGRPGKRCCVGRRLGSGPFINLEPEPHHKETDEHDDGEDQRHHRDDLTPIEATPLR